MIFCITCKIMSTLNLDTGPRWDSTRGITAKNRIVPPQDYLIRWCDWLERQSEMKDWMECSYYLL